MMIDHLDWNRETRIMRSMSYLLPGINIAVGIRDRHDEPLEGVGELLVVPVVVGQLVDDVSDECGGDPFAGVNASVDPDLFGGTTGVNVEHTHLTVLVGIADVQGNDPVEVAGHIVQPFVQFIPGRIGSPVMFVGRTIRASASIWSFQLIQITAEGEGKGEPSKSPGESFRPWFMSLEMNNKKPDWFMDPY